ncbi:MAG: serine hydrolase [Clostridia bacterium]|nr:serine hydrolase [Deltaproteobacteria bacterium]
MLLLLIIAATSAIPDLDANGKPHLRSESVAVRYADTGEVVLTKNGNVVRPIASITKLLSGLILSSQQLDRTQNIIILEDDKDRLKWSRSRLPVNIAMSWNDMLRVGLGASDNRAIYASVRAVMAREQFVRLMNSKAREIGMKDSRFVDPAGIDPENVSTAMDLLQLLAATSNIEDLRAILLSPEIEIGTNRGVMTLRNPDRLVHSTNWEIVIGKTGYTVEAGRTLAVRMILKGRPVDMVFLGSREMQSVFGDAARVRKWLEPKIAASDTAVANAKAVSKETVQ